MGSFIRRFLFDPGVDVLREIESVNILDIEPPANISGVGTGTVLCIGELENGPFNSPTEVTSATMLRNMFGGFGFIYGGVSSNNPCARTRYADSAITCEYWNGNAIAQLSGKKFSRLVLCRVDTSTGAVTFSRCAFLAGVAAFRYNLEPGQTLVVNTGVDNTVTFDATVATMTAVGGVFPSTFAGGETLTMSWDNAEQFTATFLAGDQSNAQVAARINQYAGWTFCAVSGGQLQFVSRTRGTAGTVTCVSGSTGVLTKLGLTAGHVHGTGNVANIDAVTIAEVHAAVHAVDVNVAITQDSDGAIRAINTGVPGMGTLSIKSTSTAQAFGFPVDTTSSATTGTAGVLAAGTRVRNVAGVEWVTMQDVFVTAASAGPYTVRVRPATDDGTNAGAAVSTIVVMYDQPSIGAFTVLNQLPVSAALTETQIDVAYQTALNATLDLNSVSKEINIIFSARQSNAVRRALRQNALDASAAGLYGRIACVRPPLGISAAAASSNTVEPGIGAYRSDRVVYCYPGAQTYVVDIARLGTSGGAGFTATGIIDVGADGFLASVLSQLPCEYNPGQDTPYLNAVLALEDGLPGFVIEDYVAFKRCGICALRIDDSQAFFQSGITSVDPIAHPNLVNIARRRMSDYIEDSLAQRLKIMGKKPNTLARRTAIVGEVRGFMNGLLSVANPDAARINEYSLGLSANTKQTIGMGMFRITLRCRTLSSLDSIVLEAIAGETVEIAEG